VFFTYPEFLGIKRPMVTKKLEVPDLKVNSALQYHTDHLKICIKKTFFAAGFELVDKASPFPNFVWKGPIKAKELLDLNSN
tara:strand:+ start:590 stop:832 length:243 start_codon:yes stop_codon:yes gene_type:complete